MKNKSAFTVVELVVTLGILALAFALSTVLIVTMNSVQNANAVETNKSRELTNFNDSVNSYVSFLSINTDEINFSYDGENSTENKVVFTYSTYHFDLKFENLTLSMESNYDGENTYFAKTFSRNFKYIRAVTFEYTESLGQLVSHVTFGGSVINYSHIVRTAL